MASNITHTSHDWHPPCVAGGGSSAAPMQGSAMNNFAGRMGNILVGSMAGGFGATLGSDAANSLWHDFF